MSSLSSLRISLTRHLGRANIVMSTTIDLREGWFQKRALLSAEICAACHDDEVCWLLQYWKVKQRIALFLDEGRSEKERISTHPCNNKGSATRWQTWVTVSREPATPTPCWPKHGKREAKPPGLTYVAWRYKATSFGSLCPRPQNTVFEGELTSKQSYQLNTRL